MKDRTIDVPTFSFSDPAELYGGASWSRQKTPMAYRRFDTAAEAVRFVVEETGEADGRAFVLEVNEERFNYPAIRALYDSSDYPLPRKTREDASAP